MSERQTTRTTIGARPHTVRVLERERGGQTAIVLEWREGGQRRRQLVPPQATKRETLATATAQARALHARLVSPPPPVVTAPAIITVADVYEAHVAVRGDTWRPRTRVLEADSYRLWAAWAGARTDVATLDGTALARFRRALVAETGLVFDSAHRHAARVRGQFRAAVDAGVLPGHPLATVRLVKHPDHESPPVPEFTPDQAARLVAQLNPRLRTQWRPWAVMMLAAVLGPRVHALLTQRWAHLELAPGARAIYWPRETDKTKRARWQRLPRAAMLVLRVIRVWQARDGYTGPLLFPTPRWRSRGATVPYSYPALWVALREAADRAGVPRARMQAMHAFRRFAFNSVLEATGGNLVLAAEWIGDRDLSTAQKYRRRRETDGQAVAAALDAHLALVGGATSNGPRTAPSKQNGSADAEPSTSSSPRKELE